MGRRMAPEDFVFKRNLIAKLCSDHAGSLNGYEKVLYYNEIFNNNGLGIRVRDKCYNDMYRYLPYCYVSSWSRSSISVALPFGMVFNFLLITIV